MTKPIDWTDRSQDVLTRFEVWRETEIDIDIFVESETLQLMADLATMVSELSENPAPHLLWPLSRRKRIMKLARDETGARLFPDPATDSSITAGQSGKEEAPG